MRASALPLLQVIGARVDVGPLGKSSVVVACPLAHDGDRDPCVLTGRERFTNHAEYLKLASGEMGHSRCSACCGGGLVPTPGCTCSGNAHACTPMICTMCHGTGRREQPGEAATWGRSRPLASSRER